MREILFRGKEKNTGRWIQGGFHIWEKRMLNPIGKDSLKDDEVAYTITVNSFADWNMPRTMQAVEVVPETVGQYTGLCDKNGKKIFEGDIVKVSIWYDCGCYTHSETKIKTAEIPNFYNWDIDGNTEVIGNIHDNPELLGEENPNE